MTFHFITSDAEFKVLCNKMEPHYYPWADKPKQYPCIAVFSCIDNGNYDGDRNPLDPYYEHDFFYLDSPVFVQAMNSIK